MLMIASHLDSKAPLTRILCLASDRLPVPVLPISTAVTSSTGSEKKAISIPSESLQEISSLNSGQMHHRHGGVVIDIEAIKWCHPEQPSRPENEQEVDVKESGEQRKRQPIIFVRYAVTDSDQEAIDKSANELSDEGISQRRISCSLDEIQYVVSLLQQQEDCVDEAYRTQWKEKSAVNGTVFRLSLLRPTLEPLFPYRTAKLKRRAERQAREKERIAQLARQQRRKERLMMLEAELQMRRDKGEIVDKVCCKLGCDEWALLQCSRCQNVYYCREKRKLISTSPLVPFIISRASRY